MLNMNIKRFLFLILLLPTLSFAKKVQCIHYFNHSPHIHIAQIDLDCTSLKFTVNTPNEKGLTVSELAKKYQTMVAINTNFFTQTHSPVGLVVSHGKKWQGSKDTRSKVIFACNKQNKCVMEESNKQTKLASDWQIAVSGWQYYDQKSATFTCAPQDKIGCTHDIYTGKHPRTMIGLDEKNNTLYLIVVEGRQLTYRGMNLTELADLATALGLTKAINLDGGGSSTMVINGKRVSALPVLQGSERKIASFLGVAE